jgi:hypothetical protein
MEKLPAQLEAARNEPTTMVAVTSSSLDIVIIKGNNLNKERENG